MNTVSDVSFKCIRKFQLLLNLIVSAKLNGPEYHTNVHQLLRPWNVGVYSIGALWTSFWYVNNSSTTMQCCPLLDAPINTQINNIYWLHNAWLFSCRRPISHNLISFRDVLPSFVCVINIVVLRMVSRIMMICWKCVISVNLSEHLGKYITRLSSMIHGIFNVDYCATVSSKTRHKSEKIHSFGNICTCILKCITFPKHLKAVKSSIRPITVLGETFFIPCLKKLKIKFYFLTICSLGKMNQLKYLSGGQNKNKNLFWNKTLFWNGPKYIDFFMFWLLWSTILTVKMM
jgi:hypothetical protein